MKPVHQTKFGMPEGNCLQACIASILECAIDEVAPSYVGDGSGFNEGPQIDTDNWFTRLNDWFFDRNLGLLLINLKTSGVEPSFECPNRTHVIMSGMAARGFKHSCVYIKTGESFLPEHDPHPDNSFLETFEDIMFIIRK